MRLEMLARALSCRAHVRHFETLKITLHWGMALNGLKHGGDLAWFVFLKNLSDSYADNESEGGREDVGRSRWELADG